MLEEVQEEMLYPRLAEAEHDPDVATSVEASNRAYLEAYCRNAPLMAVAIAARARDAALKPLTWD